MTELANFFPAALALLLGTIGLVSVHVAKRNYEKQRQARRESGTTRS